MTTSHIRIDEQTREVFVRGRELPLTYREYELLRQLMRRPTHIAPKEALLSAIYGARAIAPNVRMLDGLAARLRAKLNTEEDDNFVHDVWGIGYRLLSPPEDS